MTDMLRGGIRWVYPAGENRRIVVNERGLALVENGAGEWLIYGAADAQVHTAADHLAWLLPLLERRPADVVATLSSASPTSETLLLALLRFALTSWGHYWPGLALTWLESGWPTTGLLDVLAEMRSNPQLPQPLRHRALRLWRQARTEV
ncbi:hypothetical protein ACQP1P_33265 [Dactylosporangium sp. CA-052675]|uniref:hypothetical protein n=1 Tax=Dactylosporangium sp. CA-052675 TaxID=3239927 RepID=UPI003D8ADBD2